jgi:DNA-binding transcriptional LysR family regulator
MEDEGPGATLRDMQLFVNVVQNGSFSAAGRHLGFSPASVSRHINALEESLGVRLLNRTSRKLTLTEAGSLYFEKVEQILHDIRDTQEAVSQLQRAPRGRLRVHSRMLVGVLYIAPALPSFLAAYPEISVDLLFSNFPIDLVAQNVDVDIRIGSLADSSLIVRKLTASQRVIVGTPEYLAGKPPIKIPADLVHHNCLAYRTNLGKPVWRFLDAKGKLTEIAVTGTLMSDNGHALLVAASAGVGLALVPDWSVTRELREGRLVHLLPEYKVSHIEFENAVYAVYQQNRHLPAKVRLFVDFLVDLFRSQRNGTNGH